tara:strand:+ start:813 stop:2288 length:1476 start_codon:yes stop_codon:yes gene_type:complete
MPMIYDEAYTVRYTDQFASIFLYNAPNNHVLHTLLVYFSRLIFGLNEFAVRLPSFSFGIASIIIAYWVLKKYFSNDIAMIVSGFIAFSDILISFSVRARSYSMHVFFSLIIFYLIENAVNKRNKHGIILVGLVLGAALCTHFSLIYIYLASCAYGTVKILELKFNSLLKTVKEIIILWGIPIIVSIIFYIPVILATGFFVSQPQDFSPEVFISTLKSRPISIILLGIEKLINNEAVHSLTYSEFFTGLGSYCMKVFIEEPALGILPSPVFLVLFMVGIIKIIKAIEYKDIFRLLIPFFICLIFIVLYPTRPSGRMWIFVFPLIYFVVGQGIINILDGIKTLFNNSKIIYYNKFIPAFFLIIVLLKLGTPIVNEGIEAFNTNYGGDHFTPEGVNIIKKELVGNNRIIVPWYFGPTLRFYATKFSNSISDEPYKMIRILYKEIIPKKVIESTGTIFINSPGRIKPNFLDQLAEPQKFKIIYSDKHINVFKKSN